MPAAEIDTLILRFRDLATAKGETLKRHRMIRDALGFVWWGWWNKFGERVPGATFEKLNAKGDIEIVLFDSGSNKIFSAKCSEIRWDQQKGSLISSPEPDATPEYYKAQKYAAWFKFVTLSQNELPPSRLHQFTYVEVSEFFESGHTRFAAFDGKRVESPEELNEQNRTIWFVRPYGPGDCTGPVSIEPAPALKSFLSEPLRSFSTTLLWLSDLHFGRHAFPPKTDAFERDLSQALEFDLREAGQKTLAGIIISGDLTWQTSEAEFDQAIRFLGGLTSWSTLDNRRILVIPGNHDLRWSEDPTETGTPASISDAIARAAYSKFYEAYYRHAPNAFLSMGRRFVIGGGQPR